MKKLLALIFTAMLFLASFFAFPASAEEEKKIARVELTGGRLADGVTLTSSAFTTSAEGVASVSAVWNYNGYPLADGAKARPGDYMIDLTLTAAPGYVFTEDTVVSVFGSEYKVHWTEDGGATAILNTSRLTVGACGHDYYKIESDENRHWKVCLTCFATFGEGEHTYDSGKKEGGDTVYTCTVCGHTKTEPGAPETEKPADTTVPKETEPVPVTERLPGTTAGEETATPAKPDTAAVTDGAHEGTDPDESGKRSLLPWILPIALIAAFAVGGAAAFLLVRKKAGKN